MRAKNHLIGAGYRLVGALVILAVALAARPAAAQVRGDIVKAGTGQTISGNITWKASMKAYEVSKDGVTTVVPLNQVARLQVPPPPALAASAKAVSQGATQGPAVDALAKIVDDYLMLDHDLTAVRWLAEAQLKRGDVKDLSARFSRVMENRNPANVPTETLRAYWNVLLASERYTDLRKDLAWAIQQGPRPLAAVAQVLRGDIDMKRGQYRDALLGGYLRTIVLFKDVKDVQPEALSKAVKCFEELGESNNAERMRKKLLAEYPESAYGKAAQTSS